MEATPVVEPTTVVLSLEGPRAQRRLSVGFRLILAIPHILWLLVLTIVGLFAAVVAWVAALALGRMPEGLGDFLGRIVQYATRVNGYLYLLTDRYPPFSLSATDHPITVLLPPRGRLNRAAVLFRLILAVPAMIVLSVVSSGLQPLAMVIIWLIVLVAGAMPTTAFQAVAAVLRYEVRVYAWMLMLTSEYPGGLFGDAPQAPAPEAPEALELDEPETGTLPPPPPPPPTATPRITRLVLSKPAKRLLVVFIVVGVILNVGQIAVAIATGGESDEALENLEREYIDVVEASQSYGADVQGCALSGGPACVQAANQSLAAAVRTFEADLEDLDFPSYALGAVDDLRDAAVALREVLDRMAATSDPDAYQALVREFQEAATRMDQAFLDLHDLLRVGF
jgi:hypothetical protein